MTKTYSARSLSDLTDEALDDMVRKQSEKNREAYRRKFAEMVESVRVTTAPSPERQARAQCFRDIRAKVMGKP